jgi:hypothetical protein
MATSTFDLLDLTTQIRAIGRASVFYEAGAFAFAAGGTDVTMVHLGDTEGDIEIANNDEYSDLMLPELTGPAIHERNITGENPVVTIPLYVADAAVRAIVSPTASASGGFWRQRAVTEYKIWIVPENLFIEANAQAQVTYDKVATWQVGGDAATAAQLNLLDQSIWFWRGHFTPAKPIYRHPDAGKVVQPISFQPMFNLTMPDGDGLYTVGRPDQRPTAIHVAST